MPGFKHTLFGLLRKHGDFNNDMTDISNSITRPYAVLFQIGSVFVAHL